MKLLSKDTFDLEKQLKLLNFLIVDVIIDLRKIL